MKKLTIIGGGPAALMLSAQIDTAKYDVVLCEKKKTLGRKFLVAGEGGLNLTYNSPSKEMIEQYRPSEFMAPIVSQFTNAQLIEWFEKLGISTFIGSSHRIFPDLELKPIDVLNKIVAHISSKKIDFQFEKNWVGWNEDGHLCFENSEPIKSDIVVFALGGASWKVTGSDGTWLNVFEKRGVSINHFRAANCAFEVDWNEDFLNAHVAKPLKNVALTYNDQTAKGELVVTQFGLEGNPIYALSQKIQETLLTKESTIVYLDLKPTMTVDQLKAKYKKSLLKDVSKILNTDLNLNRTFIGILKQFSDKATYFNPDLLVETIKAVPIPIKAADELDKAISTLGGIALDDVDEHFQCKKIPNTFAIGEMLDWYAPTGGYLLQGCFSMGAVLAKHLNELNTTDAEEEE